MRCIVYVIQLTLNIIAATTLTAHDFDVERTIGRGSHAQIHLARVISTDKVYAVKTPLHGSEEHVMREIRAHKVINSWNLPNTAPIVPAEFYNEDRGKTVPWICYEYFPKGDLFNYAVKQTLSYDEVRSVGRDILRALTVFHSREFVLHDLKPRNVVLYEKEGKLRAKLIDLSMMSKEYQMAPYGTLPFMSPEALMSRFVEFQGVFPVTPATDLWSFATTMYAVKTGKLLFYAPGCVYRKTLFTARRIANTFRDEIIHSETMTKEQYEAASLFLNETPVKPLFDKLDCDDADCVQFRDLLSKILKFSALERISASDALEHPFFK